MRVGKARNRERYATAAVIIKKNMIDIKGNSRGKLRTLQSVSLVTIHVSYHCSYCGTSLVSPHVSSVSR